MRVLVLGGNLAGLLSALQFHRQGCEVSVLVHGQEAALKPEAPLVFTDPGPWGSRQGRLATLSGLLQDRGDFRFGQSGVAQLPWFIRFLRQRAGRAASSQAVRALALARRSKLMYDDLRATAGFFPVPEPIPQVCVYDRTQTAKAHFHRGPVWHMGSSRPCLSALSDQAHLLPGLDLRWARQKPTLTSGGMMVSNSANVVSALRQHLSQLGVLFIYDRTIDGVLHISKHLHGVTLRGKAGQVEEVDTDLVVATSVPAAWPLFKAIGLRPDLALVKCMCLRTHLAGAEATPLLIHDKSRGIRLVRYGREVWAQGPTWIGDSGSAQASELAKLTVQIARYFGPNCTPVGEVPLIHTSWVAPDGLPLIGRAPTRNIFLNIGHHSATSTLAFGATAVMQDLIDQALNIVRSTPVRSRLLLSDGPQAHNITKGQIHD